MGQENRDRPLGLTNCDLLDRLLRPAPAIGCHSPLIQPSFSRTNRVSPAARKRYYLAGELLCLNTYFTVRIARRNSPKLSTSRKSKRETSSVHTAEEIG